MKVIFALLVWVFLLFPSIAFAQSPEEFLEAEVVEIVDQGEIVTENDRRPYQRLLLETASSELIEITNGDIPSANLQTYEVGEHVVITKTQGIDSEVYSIVDYVRKDGLLMLFLLFVVLAVAIGGKWGIASIVGMGFSFLIIFSFILPQILAGNDPVFIAVIGASFIVPVTFYLSHGFQTKTHLAVAGTVLVLVVTGVLADFFVELTHLTGFASEEAGFLASQTDGNIDMKGLLLAGMIISVLGVLDDITVSQASIVLELKRANKKLSFTGLFSRAMRVGKDHVASLINTLVLVYAGASLPLLLLFTTSGLSFGQVINFEIVADEIVRTLIGSIGLVMAVPVTTTLAALVFEKRET